MMTWGRPRQGRVMSIEKKATSRPVSRSESLPETKPQEQPTQEKVEDYRFRDWASI